MDGPLLDGHLTSHEPTTSSLLHPSPNRSIDSDDSDDSVDGLDRSSVIKDLDWSYTTISKMHRQEEQLQSSLEAVEVELASAHGERVATQT